LVSRAFALDPGSALKPDQPKHPLQFSFLTADEPSAEEKDDAYQCEDDFRDTNLEPAIVQD
jgi:hypothetical protein